MNVVDIRRSNLRKVIDKAAEDRIALTDVAFCELHDLNPSHISQLIKGHGSFGERAARNLEKKIGLVSGYLDIAHHSNLSAITDLTPVETWDSNTPLDDDEVEIPFFKDFSFACGSGSIGEALANEKRKLRMSKSTLRNKAIDRKNAVATSASGDSMNPTIKDGDTIHIDLGRKTIKDGKIFAVCHGGLFLAKRLYNLPLGGVRIVSDNAAEYPEIQLTAQEIIEQQFEVVGWIWQISTMENW